MIGWVVYDVCIQSIESYELYLLEYFPSFLTDKINLHNNTILTKNPLGDLWFNRIQIYCI